MAAEAKALTRMRASGLPVSVSEHPQAATTASVVRHDSP